MASFRGVFEGLSPPALLALLYFGLIVAGALLLLLPVSNTHGISVGEAFFTSTSAVTVTGLSVIDTGTSFTTFGEVVIAVLMQCGGLGLMTFAVLVLAALGIPVGLPQKRILREDLNQTSLSNLGSLAWVAVQLALVCEGVGAALLALVFVPELGVWTGLWHSVFHAVSAFNNAGFALYPDGLSGWVGNPIVNLVIPALFMIGGLGFVVVVELRTRRSWRRLSLHSKIMLAGSGVLIVSGCLGFALLEWDNPATLGGLPTLSDKLWASWFQGVTPRTAGFNTVNLAGIHDSTALMIMTLMLVGGGSTSTAGGIKVTTLWVLVLATIAFFRRRKELHIFGRSLGAEEVMQVMAITTMSILVVLTSIFLISISHDGEFLDLAFEVTSAFGTVGLSRGATGELDGIGRVLVMITMFIGRVGPLTLGFFLATQALPRVRYPKGQVYVG